MEDNSHLDKKYFIDSHIYNCPFCNRRHVKYTLLNFFGFDWSGEKKCYIHLIKCDSCEKVSMHLSYEEIAEQIKPPYDRDFFMFYEEDIDSKIFYSVPTSFFVMDSRIPKIIRELITEAEGCLKMNFLTGASACMRKAIYEFTAKEKAEGIDYKSRIKYLKGKFNWVDSTLFDILAAIQGMTSEKIHEQSWDEWDSANLMLIIETLKTILHEIYVLPKQKEESLKAVRALQEKILKKKSKAGEEESK